MRLRHLVPLAAFSLLALAAPSEALAADQTGSTGAVLRVELNTPSADTYLQYHGKVVIRSGKTNTEYRWGGTSCGSRVLADDHIDLLVQAARDNDKVTLTPRFQTGQAGAKCIVGFSLMKKR